MEEFFQELQAFDWPGQDCLTEKSKTRSESHVNNETTHNISAHTTGVPHEEIPCNTQGCNDLINLDKPQVPENHDNKSLPDPDIYVKLKDPPDVNEILSLDEERIQATSHNVSILNAACQKVLKEMEQTLLNHLEKNRKEQEDIIKYVNSTAKSKNCDKSKKVNLKCLGIPYFKDSDGYPPPLNQDVIKKKQCNKLLPVDFINGSHVWSLKDSKMLIKSVTENEGQQSEVNKLPVDWMKISATSMDGKYSPSECRSMWLLNLSPNVNKAAWRSKEINNLKKVSEKYNYQNWDQIAKELGTNRSGFQCCVQYHTHKFAQGGRWTKEEDNALMKIIQQFKVKDNIPWKKVVWNFEGRSLRQCQERYAYHLQKIKKGNFTMQEDYILVYLYSRLKSFKEVAKYFPNRVSTQIRSRYNYLVRITMPEFSKEEDELLTQLMAKYPGNWKKISEHFENRSRVQCRGRWAHIQKQIHLKNSDDLSDNDSEGGEGVNNSDENENDSVKETIDATNINKNLRQLARPDTRGKCKKKISEQYKKLLEYCSCGFKFLFGPKPRVPSHSEEKEQLCNKIKITMKTLSINYAKALSTFEVHSLANDCAFDAEDLVILEALKAEKNDHNERRNEITHRILPPNYMTLVGLRTLMLHVNKMKNFSGYYSAPDETQHRNANDRILFSDAKKLFKCRLKTLFAFPLILSNISQEGIQPNPILHKKTKRNKPLSQRKRKLHGKMMLTYRLAKKMKTVTGHDLDQQSAIVNDVINQNNSTTTSLEPATSRVKRGKGRPRKCKVTSETEIQEPKKPTPNGDVNESVKG